MESRRDFLKKIGVAGLVASAAPILAKSESLTAISQQPAATQGKVGELIIPKGKALPITGTFLDEISTDIPHQNWGYKEWDQDFKNMKAIGINTVIDIRCGLGKQMAYPSPYMLSKGFYQPSVDLIEIFCTLADKYGMDYWHGLYDSGTFWTTRDFTPDMDINRHVIDEVWERYGHHKCFKGWYLSFEISRNTQGMIENYNILGRQCKDVSKSTEHPNGLPTFISPSIDGKKAVSVYSSQLNRTDDISVQEHERDWNNIFDGIHNFVDAVAFQDGYTDYDEIEPFLKVNKQLADKYGMECWTNCESFDRDMPIKFFPIKFDKLLWKLLAAKRCGYKKAITFEFSHFMSPQSAYLQASYLYDRYKEYFNIK